MTFKLSAGKLGFKLGAVLVGLKSGTEDVPEALKMDEGAAHIAGMKQETARVR